MIDPDEVRTGEAECVAAPDVLVVQVADLDVLDDDILSSKGQTLALDDAFGANPEDRLVGPDLDGRLCSLVVSHCLLDLSSTARVQQDALAFRPGTPRRTYTRQHAIKQDSSKRDVQAVPVTVPSDEV